MNIITVESLEREQLYVYILTQIFFARFDSE